MGGRGPEAYNQSLGPGVIAVPVAGESVQSNRAAFRHRKQFALGELARHLEHCVQPGISPTDREPGRRTCHSGDDGVAAMPVPTAHRPHVSIQVARLDQFSKGDLVENADGSVGHVSDFYRGFEERLWQCQPSQADAGRQDLRRHSAVNDMIWIEALQDADRRAVIAKLPVVIVLDHVRERLVGLAAWRESPYFTQRERAALTVTDSITCVGEGHVPDEVWSEASLHFSGSELAQLVWTVIVVNSWNRVAITTRMPPQSLAKT